MSPSLNATSAIESRTRTTPLTSLASAKIFRASTASALPAARSLIFRASRARRNCAHPSPKRLPSLRKYDAASSSDCAARTSSLVRTWDWPRSEEHTSELQSHSDLVCRLLLEKKKVALH